jgi:hypothetical protein
MNVGLRLAVVIGFIAICCVSLAIANRPPEGREFEQTLPSPYLISEDFEYFSPGPEFKLQREAAAMRAYRDDLEAQRAGWQR